MNRDASTKTEPKEEKRSEIHPSFSGTMNLPITKNSGRSDLGRTRAELAVWRCNLEESTRGDSFPRSPLSLSRSNKTFIRETKGTPESAPHAQVLTSSFYEFGPRLGCFNSTMSPRQERSETSIAGWFFAASKLTYQPLR